MAGSQGLARAVALRTRDILRDNKRHGWTQDWLAKEIGLTQSMVSLILAGRRRKLGLDTWDRIARAIDLPLSTLIAQAESRIVRERDSRPRSA